MEQHPHASREKRNFSRIKTDAPAEVMLPRSGRRFDGICRDLSGGGLKIEARVGLRIGTRAEITLASSYGGHPMLRAAARVVRLQRKQAGNFVLGLEILEILD